MDAPKAGASNHWDAGETLADRFRVHVGNAEHLYGYAVRGMAQDWETGGPVRMACSGYENAPRGSAIHLRLLAGVFRLVLTGRAEELVAFYPCLGGSALASQAWPVIREVIGAHVDEMHAALAVPPQTNEVGRSAALLAGLFDLVAASGVRRIRLLEVGASAGLNLLLDHYAYRGDSWQFGFTDSKIQFVDSIEGPVQPEHFMITSRAGCDLHPVDATTADGRLLLTSFVWPFDLDRHQRLSLALAIAAVHPVRIDRASAIRWLRYALTDEPDGLPVSGTQSPRCIGRAMKSPPLRASCRATAHSTDSARSALSSTQTVREARSPSCVLGYGTRVPAVRFVNAGLAPHTTTASPSHSQPVDERFS